MREIYISALQEIEKGDSSETSQINCILHCLCSVQFSKLTSWWICMDLLIDGKEGRRRAQVHVHKSLHIRYR